MLSISVKTDYQKLVAQQIHDEEIGCYDEQKSALFIDDNDLYSVDIERLKQFDDVPDFFDGKLAVMTAVTRPKNPFTVLYRLTWKKKGTEESLGSQIPEHCYIDFGKQRFLLNKEHFELCQLIRKVSAAQESEIDTLNWMVFSLLEKSDKESIEKTTFNKDDILRDVSYVEIAVKQNKQGDLEVFPYLPEVSDEEQTLSMRDSILSNTQIAVYSTSNYEMGKKHGMIRHLLDEEVFKSYKKVANTKRIDHKDALKFLQNPAAFILKDEESEDDFKISFESYRILGLGEPYVGYFGSKNLDSPIAKALANNADQALKKEIIQLAQRITDGLSVEEFDKLREKVSAARQRGGENVVLDDGTVIPSHALGLFENQLNKIHKSIPQGIATDSAKLVIRIDPNDEQAIVVDCAVHVKALEEISLNNLYRGVCFDSLRYSPKTYQLMGVNWLIDLYQNRYRGGILADDMGLGKTYQLIAFIQYLFTLDKYQGKSPQRVLIVAPTVLLKNWCKEFEKLLKKEVWRTLADEVFILNSTVLRRHRKEHTTNEGSYNTFDIELLLELQNRIIITSYETLSNYQFSFADCALNFGCVIFDEAHKIKNPNAQISQAARAIASQIDFSVLLTGTPIENELRDLWALFDVFDPHHFGSWKQFRQEFVNATDDVDVRLRAKASNYLLRRLKKDYLQELPQKIEQKHEFSFSSEESAEYLNYRDNLDPALAKLNNLKSFSLHQGLLSKETLGAEDFWSFSKAKKLQELLHTIQQKDEKVIIFVISKTAQDLLRFHLSNYFGLDVQVINGDNNKGNHVEKVLDNFANKPGFNILLLSTLAAGVGLTIVEANHVIHYERWWNASKEDQASDRAYRIGQQKDVYIHYLIGKLDTDSQVVSMDEAIDSLISMKREKSGFLIPPKSVGTNEIISAVIPTSTSDMLAALHWQDFEYIVQTIYEAQGYSCYLTEKVNGEGGADIIATHRETMEKLAIQCKHSQKGYAQDQEAIFQLVMESREKYKPQQLIAVTNTYFTQRAKDIAEREHVTLIEGDEISQLYQKFISEKN